MCRSFDPKVAKKCREDDAEEVRAKEQANFCDYFRPRPGAFDALAAAAERKAKDQLAGLFGGPSKASAPGEDSPADALFSPKPKGSS